MSIPEGLKQNIVNGGGFKTGGLADMFSNGKVDISNPFAIQLLKNTFKSNPIAFGKFFFPRFFSSKTPDFHREITEMYVDKINKVESGRFKDITKTALIVPRGHAKTTIAVSLFFLWAICHRKFKYALHITNTASLAVKNLNDIANELLTNDLLKRFYYPNNEINSGTWNKESIECFIPNEAGIVQSLCIDALGSGKALRGTKYNMQRPDVIIIDDLEDSEQVLSKEQRSKLKNWYEGDVVPCFGTTGYLCIIGTILHFDSLLNNIKENTNEAFYDYNVIEYKAINKRKEVIIENGEEIEKEIEYALWEDRKSLEWLYKERDRLALGGELSTFYREYMNTPISDEEKAFKDEVMVKNIYSKEWLDLQLKTRQKELFITMGIDTAISQKESADFSSIVILGTDEEGFRYTLEAWHDRCSPDVLRDKVFEFYKRYLPKVIAMQKAGIDQLYKSNFEEKMRKDNIFFKITPALYNTATGNSKEARIKGLITPFNTNTLKIAKEHTDLQDELSRFPFGKHDDLLDALQMAFAFSMSLKKNKLTFNDINKNYNQFKYF